MNGSFCAVRRQRERESERARERGSKPTKQDMQTYVYIPIYMLTSTAPVLYTLCVIGWCANGFDAASSSQCGLGVLVLALRLSFPFEAVSVSKFFGTTSDMQRMSCTLNLISPKPLNCFCFELLLSQGISSVSLYSLASDLRAVHEFWQPRSV